MSWKNDLIKDIKEIQQSVEKLQDNADPVPLDAAEDFAPTQVISKRSKLEAIRSSVDLFKKLEDGKLTGIDEQQQFINYTIPQKYQREYYMRAISPYGFGFFALAANIVSNDERLSNKSIYAFILWAIMFDGMGLMEEDGKYVPCYISKDGTIF